MALKLISRLRLHALRKAREIRIKRWDLAIRHRDVMGAARHNAARAEMDKRIAALEREIYGYG